MNNRAEERELQLFGAYVASAEVRKEVSSEDFTVNRLRLGVKEIEDIEAGKLARDKVVYLPFLMESLKFPNGAKYIDGLIATVKGYTRAKKLNKVCLMSSWATKTEDVESIKEKVRQV